MSVSHVAKIPYIICLSVAACVLLCVMSDCPLRMATKSNSTTQNLQVALLNLSKKQTKSKQDFSDNDFFPIRNICVPQAGL